MSSHVEAVSVGLHDIDAGATGVAISLFHGAVSASVDQIEAGDAAGRNLAHVGGILDATTD